MALDRDRVAALLPAYEIGGEIGRGAWGIVLHGRHLRLGRDVAVKQLPRAFGNDPAVRARFVAEARLLASLDHPHVVPVFDYVEQDGMCLIVMEQLNGGTVWSYFTEHGLSPENTCAIVLATLLALEHAHRLGVLHRDIKPENLLLSGSKVLKVSDFGIATVIGGTKTVATRAGEVLGTPAFMAPEQAQGLSLTPATDVYAVGVMLYELLSGQLPFADEGHPLSVLYRHVHEEPVALRDVAPDVPSGLASAVMRAMAKRVESRFESAEAFGVALAEAATSAWGVGWLSRSEFKVMASGPILAVTERAPKRRTAPPRSKNRASIVRPTFEAHRLSRIVEGSSDLQLFSLKEQALTPPVGVAGPGTDADSDMVDLRRVTASGDGAFTPEEVEELVRLASEQDIATRCGYERGTPVATLRSAARSGIKVWRTKAASPLADRTRTRVCETAARLYEAIYAQLVSD